jgi:hypothetical protein
MALYLLKCRDNFTFLVLAQQKHGILRKQVTSYL